MKYLKFAALGVDYPFALEQHYERILKKLAELWDTPDIDDYFTSLLIDTRGGRQGFPDEVFRDIQCLYSYHDTERLQVVIDRTEAVRELELQGVFFTQDEFIRAVKEGNPAHVDLFIRGGMNVLHHDHDGNSLFMLALKRGFSIVANILLAAGADIEDRDAMGFSPLLLTCGKETKGFQQLAMKLIRHGANVNIHDPLGWTPLCLAVSAGNTELVKALLEQGADIYVKTRKNESVFDLAKKFHHQDMIKLLHEHHRSLDFLSADEIPLFWAEQMA